MTDDVEMKLFDNPEIEALITKLFERLLDESDRGAILIGTAQVEATLESLINAVIPTTISNKKRKTILNYPGVLSSFASKIEMAFVFRVIPKILYDALHSLREIRNAAAHSSEKFDLKDKSLDVDNVLCLGPATQMHIHKMAITSLLKSKSQIILDTFKSFQDTDPDFKNYRFPATNIEEACEFIIKNSEYVRMIQVQLPKWVLIIGISFLCGMLVYYKNRIAGVLGPDKTIYSLSK